jgi:integrase
VIASGNNEGTITKRVDGRWEARITLDGGRRKCFYGRTAEEVRRKLAAATRSRDSGLPIAADERQTLEAFLAGWLGRVKPTIRPRTWIRYRELLAHVTPALGRVALAKLAPTHAERLYATLLGEGLSTTTVHHLHTVLHHALSDALRKGLVPRNVCDLVDAPKMRRHTILPLSADQALQLLAAAEGHRLEALFLLALTTGLREGELLALTWATIDLDGASLEVRGNLQRIERQLIISAPKTDSSRRHVALTGLSVDALRRHKARQAEERLAMGPLWEDHNLVFCRENGRPIDGTGMLRGDFYPLLARAGLPRVRFHDLRHSTATLLMSLGIDLKIISEILGHSSVRITGDVYTHVSLEMQRPAAQAMDTLLRRRQVNG